MSNAFRHILLAAAVCVVLALPSFAGATDESLPIVFEDYPPYEFVEDGEVRGINMDLIREAFKRMGITPYFEPRPWKRAIFQLKSGEILALSSGFKTEERMKFAVFPNGPLGMETNMIIARADRDITVNSLDDIQRIRLGVVREYAYGEPFDSIRGLHKIKAQSSHQLLRMLLEGRVDAVIGNKAVFGYIAKRKGAFDQIKFVYEVSSEPLYLMFSRARGPRATNLARDFGNAIQEMIKDGTFDTIQARY